MKNKEKIMENAQECYKNFVMSRIEIALLRLNSDTEYLSLCAEKESIEPVLEKMNDFGNLMLKRYIETLSIKANMECQQSYLQGVQDGIRSISKLMSDI